MEKELEYLRHLIREPRCLHSFGRKKLNDPQSSLDFTSDKAMEWLTPKRFEEIGDDGCAAEPPAVQQRAAGLGGLVEAEA